MCAQRSPPKGRDEHVGREPCENDTPCEGYSSIRYTSSRAFVQDPDCDSYLRLILHHMYRQAWLHINHTTLQRRPKSSYPHPLLKASHGTTRTKKIYICVSSVFRFLPTVGVGVALHELLVRRYTDLPRQKGGPRSVDYARSATCVVYIHCAVALFRISGGVLVLLLIGRSLQV